ncbi:MAG: lamin tail domain-containing protein [Ginsengibacter sp.]
MARNFISCFCIFLFTGLFSKAQLSENFNDGDFTDNPKWSGNAPGFIVNSSFQLQSNNTVANSNYFLTTPNSLATSAQWEMYIRMGFNPSSANYIDIYLTASDADLALNSNTGYFVRIGNTDDEISLYRKDAGGIVTRIIDGSNGVVSNSNNAMKVRVIRDAGNQWILYRDMSGTGDAYISEGTVTDDRYTVSSFFGFSIKQSTASFFQKHFFDDIEIRNYEPDITPPFVQSAAAISSNTLDVLFNEPVESVSSLLATNYSVNNNLGNPATAIQDAVNPSVVHLTFATAFTNGTVYTLTINGIRDLAGNIILNGTANFSFYIPQRYNVVIDEIMADPVPQVGLPNSEWIELRNTSAFPINLEGWKLSDVTVTSGDIPDFILQPDSFVIVCGASAVSSLAPFGKVISVTRFPSLDNDGDLISLFSSAGKAIHSVQYTSLWYKNELKKDGGWALEMINTKNPCSGISNWTASKDVRGGTPGEKNSVDGINMDKTAPKLLRSFAIDNTNITLFFDKPLDSLGAAALNNYMFDNGIVPIHVETISPVFDKVHIVLNTPMITGTVYTVTVVNVSDCIGNTIGIKNKARFGLSQEADSLDIVVNEVLFNPKTGGADYVELYNRSQKIIDLSQIFIANRNSSNVISSIQRITGESILFFPGDFTVLTPDPEAVKSQYLATNPDAFIQVSPMPSFPDDAGYVIILNNQGLITDEVHYADKWHFPLISNTEGVSLERIDYDGPSLQNNFHSAATSAGYGTPGYKNSQYRINEQIKGEIKVTPGIFSPDNDGIDDFAMVEYNFPSPGYVTNIIIFDASGRAVRYLQRNALGSLKGYYRWDGLDDKNRNLPQGIYIIYTEIFNKDGKKKQFKNTIVLARRTQ